MSARTGIQWTDATWNPVVGCTQVSPGCAHCYAKTLHDMRHRAVLAGKKLAPQYAVPFETVQLKPERLTDPLAWREPRRIFVNSVSDLFHDDVPFEYIAQVFAIMSLATRHTFQVLTKRPARMLAFFDWVEAEGVRLQEMPTHETWDGTNVVTHHACIANLGDRFDRALSAVCDDFPPDWPLENVWIGVSVENQRFADERIPLLLQTPAAVRFLSCEPLLGPLDLDVSRARGTQPEDISDEDDAYGPALGGANGIDWVIIGGESGKDARQFDLNWAAQILEDCDCAEVPVFVKQLGANAWWCDDEISQGGHGDDLSEWPEWLRVREFPMADEEDAA